jgi:signal transduction histidine kinase
MMAIMSRLRVLGSWAAAVVVGLYRSVMLVGLTAPIAACTAAVVAFGSWWTLSWTAGVRLSWPVKTLATVAELALPICWATVVFVALMLACGQRLSETARACAREWLGLRVEPRYRPVPPVTLMASGHWWNGHDYDDSEREARFHATLNVRRRDPQLRRDALWMLISAVTVLPVAALPLLGVGGGIYLLATTGTLVWGALLIVAGAAVAPFCWKILGPVAARLLGPAPRSRLDQRVEELESIRADMTQAQAAELERIERGLHDGAQARMVALGLSLGAAQRLVDTDPDTVKAILAEAQASSAVALTELRSLVRGINPPVLVERGLVDAVRALALDAPVPVTVHASLPARPERPIESAVYFAVAELIANVAKHARANSASVELDHRAGTLTVTVTDDGTGGAVESAGSGLAGVRRRVAAFGGRLDIDSPSGGPTRITVAVPCVLS